MYKNQQSQLVAEVKHIIHLTCVYFTCTKDTYNTGIDSNKHVKIMNKNKKQTTNLKSLLVAKVLQQYM